MKMGAREFLFLWSMCLEEQWDWPGHWETAQYDPSTDCVQLFWVMRSMRFKVNREGSESCDILKKRGITQEQIDEAVKKYLEET